MKINKESPARSKQGNKEKNNPSYSNSTEAQRQRVLELFKNEHYALSTLDFRERGILHPAGRIQELRAAGHDIKTIFVRQPDSNGVLHRVAQYVYCGHRDQPESQCCDITCRVIGECVGVCYEF